MEGGSNPQSMMDFEQSGQYLYREALELRKDNKIGKALQKLKQAVDRDHLDAIFELAHAYHRGGWGVESDHREARRLYEALIERDYLRAIPFYIYLFTRDSHCRMDPEVPDFEPLRDKVLAGKDPFAIGMLLQFDHASLGIPESKLFKLRASCLERAVRAGNILALHYFSRCCGDRFLWLELNKRAAEKGLLIAQETMACDVRDDDVAKPLRRKLRLLRLTYAERALQQNPGDYQTLKAVIEIASDCQDTWRESYFRCIIAKKCLAADFIELFELLDGYIKHHHPVNDKTADRDDLDWIFALEENDADDDEDEEDRILRHARNRRSVNRPRDKPLRCLANARNETLKLKSLDACLAVGQFISTTTWELYTCFREDPSLITKCSAAEYMVDRFAEFYESLVVNEVYRRPSDHGEDLRIAKDRLKNADLGICLKPVMLYVATTTAHKKAVLSFLCVWKFGSTRLSLAPLDIIKMICRLLPVNDAELWMTEEERNRIIHGDSNELYESYKASRGKRGM